MRTIYTDVVCAVVHFDLFCACFYLTFNGFSGTADFTSFL